MEFLYGLLTAVAFFIAFYLGKRYGNKTPTKQKDEVEAHRQKQMYDYFQNMMNYDVDTALRRKKV